MLLGFLVMGFEWRLLLAWIVVFQLGVSAELFFKPFNVSYDHRALIIDGNRRMLISAGIHYPRATPEMWPDIIAKTKEGGADVIQSYTFWNLHEPTRGQYNFEGRSNIVKFVKLVGASGLFFHLRIGPYVCAEWNFGGFPVWLRDVPGIEFRTDNAPFKAEMHRYVKKMVDLMLQEKLFCWQGGPIIMLQIENEYGNIESSYGQRGKDYVTWAARMALGLGAGVPWVMCRQTDAPENIIDACNGFYCDGFRPNSNKKPALWTEEWNGWYTTWGGTLPHRPVQDIAFAVARFFQRGGSFQNYYMYFGGTNFGRTSGGPFYITSYDYDAPIDEYGLLSQPKWGHLKDLHAAIKLCEPALVAVDGSPEYIKLGPKQEAHIYSQPIRTEDLNLSLSGNVISCSAFLANIDEFKKAKVTFLGRVYTLPPWSVSILPDCEHVAFNTAKVGAQMSIKTMDFDLPYSSNMTKPGLLLHKETSYLAKSWMALKEPIGAWGENNFTVEGILEHLNVTKDTSDYLWYMTRIHISDEDISFWEANGENKSTLIIDSMRDVVQIFTNGQFAGSATGRWVRVVQPIHLLQGYNELAILSETVGLQNYGAFLEKDGAGFRGQIKLSGLKKGELDLSKSLWTHQIHVSSPPRMARDMKTRAITTVKDSGAMLKISRKITPKLMTRGSLSTLYMTQDLFTQVGLKGEFMKVYAPDRHQLEDWIDLSPDAIPSMFTWYRTYFDAPAGMDPVALDFGSMGKGQAWINGHNIGRYWSLVAPKDGCQKTCDYRGTYTEAKCATNCGKPTQRWYHVPRSWLQASDNLLVIFEETGGNPLKISIKLRQTSTICSQVSQSHHPPLHMWSHHPHMTEGNSLISHTQPEMRLQCDHDYVISGISFASYGTPRGSCQKFSRGKCHSTNSHTLVSKACQGRNSCSINVSNEAFGFDPCRGSIKTLAVEAICSPSSNIGDAGVYSE